MKNGGKILVSVDTYTYEVNVDRLFLQTDSVVVVLESRS